MTCSRITTVDLDNSEARHDANNNPNVNWTLADQLERVLNILSNKTIVRPTKDETAMYIANGARFRSACLSRQVGAALSDRSGSVISTGTNEVPKAGGGLYIGSADSDPDHRCAYTSIHGGDKFCSNTREQKTIANDLVVALEKLLPKEVDKDALTATILTSRIGGLIEFSRAVHAEMDALLSAARSQAGTIGSRLHVTTFPCHFCARHIVAAGVDEVQYIEPYPKSKALELHRDAITTTATGWKAPSEGGSHVLFRPFTGIAPRLYGRAFSKEFELKDPDGNLTIGVPVWGDAWGSLRVSYADLEAALDR